jgi:hypothetical protein
MPSPFVGSPLADRCLRVLVEATQEDPAAATATALAIDAVLDRARAGRPRLHHGEGLGTWAVLDAALRRGHDIRIGLEDTLQRPDGQPARGNAELVELAVALLEKHGRRPASLPPDRTPPRRTRPLSGS